MRETTKFLDINDILGHSDSHLAKYYKKLISSVFKVDKLNHVFTRSLVGNDPLATLENAINNFNITLTANHDELAHIPKKGPAIVIANHPTGIADAIIILKTLLSIRKDIKILANHWLKQPNCFNPLIIPVNVYDKTKRLKPVIDALHYLENDYLIFLFPAGEVSSYHFQTKTIDDSAWSQLPFLLEQKIKAPIIPIHIAGKNDFLFYFLGKINPALRTSKLPATLFNKKNLIFHLTIGHPIPNSLFNSKPQQKNILYDLTYALPHTKKYSQTYRLNHNRADQHSIAVQKTAITHLLEDEIKTIREENCLLKKGHYSIYLLPSKKIPHVLQQIGIERERAFRAANMGTGNAIDLDCYDQNYQQLFIWDNEKAKIAGGYRLKITEEIDFDAHSLNKSYLSSLYRFDNSIADILPPFLEMGRSFVAFEYHRNKMILSLLLKGIAKTVMQHLDKVQMATGLVSFSLHSQSEIINHILLEYLYEKSLQSPPWLKKLKPIEAYTHKPKLNKAVRNIAKHAVCMIELEKQLSYLFNERIKLPSLFKLYECIGAKIGTISIDKKFSNCIDVIYYWNYAHSDFERLKFYFTEEDLAVLTARSKKS